MSLFLLQWLTLLTSGSDTGQQTFTDCYPAPGITGDLNLLTELVCHSWCLCSSDENLNSRFSANCGIGIGIAGAPQPPPQPPHPSLPPHLQVHPNWEIAHAKIARKGSDESILMQLLVFCCLLFPRNQARKENPSFAPPFKKKSTVAITLGYQKPLILTQQNCTVEESREDSSPGRIRSPPPPPQLRPSLWKLNIWTCPFHFRVCVLFPPQFTQCRVLLLVPTSHCPARKGLIYPTARGLYGLFHIYFNYISILGQCIYFKSHYLQLPKHVSTKRTVSI